MSISRERFIAAGAAVAGAAFPALLPQIGEAADQIRIGAVVPLTGPYGAAGISMANGIVLASETWNKRGGAMTRETAVVREDDQADPGVAAQKAREVINQDKCLALIGTVSSASALSVGAPRTRWA